MRATDTTVRVAQWGSDCREERNLTRFKASFILHIQLQLPFKTVTRQINLRTSLVDVSLPSSWNSDMEPRFRSLIDWSS